MKTTDTAYRPRRRGFFSSARQMVAASATWWQGLDKTRPSILRAPGNLRLPPAPKPGETVTKFKDTSGRRYQRNNLTGQIFCAGV